MLSMSLMNGGGCLKLVGGSAPKHVEQFLQKKDFALGLLRIPSTWSFCEAFRTNITQ
jgi:monomeric isocitrate dehydrogenase